nr:amidohydrolase family protein [Sphingobium subterraneum]
MAVFVFCTSRKRIFLLSYLDAACFRDLNSRGHFAMSDNYKIISSDSHVIEPWYLWQERLPQEFRDRAPKLVSGENGDRLVCEDVEMPPIGTAAGVFRKNSEVRQTGRWEDDVPASSYDPGARIAELERDGIWGEVMYPTFGLGFYGIDDVKFKWALLRAYNDWLAEFCQYDPKRYKGIAMVANDDPELAAEELRRVKKLGLVGVMIPTVAGEGVPQYHERGMDPLWKAAVDNGMSVNVHSGTTRDRNKKSAVLQVSGGRNPTKSPLKYEVIVRPMLNMIFGGVFERFPELTFVSAENEAGWAPHVLERADYEWERYANVALKDFESRIPRPPSDYFRKNIKLTFLRDSVAILSRHLFGVETIMFQTDFPHGVSTYPNSRKMVDDMFAGIDTADRDKIVYQNAADLYGF